MKPTQIYLIEVAINCCCSIVAAPVQDELLHWAPAFGANHILLNNTSCAWKNKARAMLMSMKRT